MRRTPGLTRDVVRARPRRAAHQAVGLASGPVAAWRRQTATTQNPSGPGSAGWGYSYFAEGFAQTAERPWPPANLPEPNQAKCASRRVGGARPRSLRRGLTVQTCPHRHEAEMKVSRRAFYFPACICRVQRHLRGWGWGRVFAE